MKKIVVCIDVEEEVCKKAAETNNLSDAINGELEWIVDSGMHVASWEFIGE